MKLLYDLMFEFPLTQATPFHRGRHAECLKEAIKSNGCVIRVFLKWSYPNLTPPFRLNHGQIKQAARAEGPPDREQYRNFEFQYIFPSRYICLICIQKPIYIFRTQ